MRRLLLLFGIAALAVTACGGGEDSDTTPAEVLSGLTRGDFVLRADRICTQGRKHLILAANRHFGGLPSETKPSDAAVTTFSNRDAIPILRRQYARLRELDPPPGDEQQIARILDQAELGISQLQEDPTILNRGSGIPPGLQQARQGAFEYGLGACGQPIERPSKANDLAP